MRITRKLRDALRRVWKGDDDPELENRSYGMDVDWHGRTDRYFPGDITEKMMEREDPDFKRPEDRWRPKRTLG